MQKIRRLILHNRVSYRLKFRVNQKNEMQTNYIISQNNLNFRAIILRVIYYKIPGILRLISRIISKINNFLKFKNKKKRKKKNLKDVQSEEFVNISGINSSFMHFVFSYVRSGLLPSDAFLVFYFQKHVDLEFHFFNLCVITKYVFYSLYSYHASKFFLSKYSLERYLPKSNKRFSHQRRR